MTFTKYGHISPCLACDKLITNVSWITSFWPGLTCQATIYVDNGGDEMLFTDVHIVFLQCTTIPCGPGQWTNTGMVFYEVLFLSENSEWFFYQNQNIVHNVSWHRKYCVFVFGDYYEYKIKLYFMWNVSILKY